MDQVVVLAACLAADAGLALGRSIGSLSLLLFSFDAFGNA
jgi:hypothetical protein